MVAAINNLATNPRTISWLSSNCALLLGLRDFKFANDNRLVRAESSPPGKRSSRRNVPESTKRINGRCELSRADSEENPNLRPRHARESWINPRQCRQNHLQRNAIDVIDWVFASTAIRLPPHANKLNQARLKHDRTIRLSRFFACSNTIQRRRAVSRTLTCATPAPNRAVTSGPRRESVLPFSCVWIAFGSRALAVVTLGMISRAKTTLPHGCLVPTGRYPGFPSNCG